MKNSVLVCLLLLAGSASAAEPTVFVRFDAWLAKYTATDSDAEHAALRTEGLRLAEERKEALSRLMDSDPPAALKVSHPRQDVPAFLAPMMEQQLDTHGRFNVMCEYGKPLRREIEVGNAKFDVQPWGAWQSVLTKDRVHLEGFTLGKKAVVKDSHAPRDNVPQMSPYTVGNKKLLYIRVDFSDDPGEPITVAIAQSHLATLDAFEKAASYNRTSVTSTVIPMVLRMPGTKASYASQNATSQLLNDARTAARNAGYNPSSYDFEAVAFREIGAWSWAGLGYVGQRGLWLNGSFDLRVIGHEFGHNLGLSHANFWQASNDSIFGAGNSEEYGNPYDIMGSGDNSHYCAWYKYDLLDWLNAGEVSRVTSSGTYPIQDLEQPILGGLHAIEVPISGTRSYWVEYRPANVTRGAFIYWGYPQSQSSQLLDMTPWTRDAHDAWLEVGRTFSDPGAGIHITPTGTTAGNPSGITLVVNRGAFTGNRAPAVSLMASSTQVNPGASVTFTATATDADGDPLAYFWDFGDTSIPNVNASTTSRVFSTSREVLARVTVSDMKGGVGSAQIVVRVGSPVTKRITGRVSDTGTGVEGVRVISGQRFTFTDSNGDYILVGIGQGSASVTAVKPGYTLSPTFANPVSVGASGATGIDFTATRAGFGVFGRVTSLGQPVVGATVIAGQYSVLTNATGDYQFINIPNGIYQVSVNAGPNRAFKEVGWTNPVSVNGAPVTGRNFAEDVQPVTIEVSGMAGPHAVSNTQHTWQTALVGSAWTVTVPVAPGLYNFFGSTTGQILTPNGFTNPVTIAGAPVTLRFTATAGNAFHILGRIDEAGAPLAGAVVTVKAGSTTVGTSTTDAEGRYVVLNNPDGMYDVTPFKSGYTFSPMTRAVTVAGADVANTDFTVLGANARPTIAIPPSATPIPITGTTADLFVLGDDAAPGDEASLTYTWAQVFGPANVTFSRNGTNGAKATTVTFPRAGAWGFTVTVTDPGGLSAAATLTVVVPQTPTTTTVNPASATVNVGESKQLVASVADQFGNVIDGVNDAMWAVSGCGSISEYGKFTAESPGNCTATATLLGKAGTCALKVQVSPVPRVVTAASVTPSPVMGKSATASVLADDDGGEANLTYTWSAANPPGVVTFSPNGNNAAKNTTVTFEKVGTYVLRVDIADERGLTASDFVTVEVVNGLASIKLTPASAVARVNESVKISVEGTDFLGGTVSVTNCTWASTGGAVDAFGAFSSTTEGTFTVTATCMGQTGTIDIAVSNATPMPRPCGCNATPQGGALFGLLLLASFLRRRNP